MSGWLQRWIAELACRVLQGILPASLQSWGRAVRYETASIADDTQALRFALESLMGLTPRAALSHLQAIATLMREGLPVSEDVTIMNRYESTILRPRVVGIACAIAAVTLGLAYMGIAGAPARYLGINVSALVIGLTVLSLVHRTFAREGQCATVVITAIACVLLATALLGDTAAGASRWVNLGGLSIQPSLVLLPLMIVAYARLRSKFATSGMIAAAIALAIQPDRAMAGMMAAGLAILATLRPEKHVATALFVSAICFASTLFREDTLPAVPYVDKILYSAFDVHLVAGAAVLAGSILLLIPAIVGWFRDSENRSTYAVFGVVWFTAIMAAALGNYPTPIVGYGGSAIIGYALSLLALPKPAVARAKERTRSVDGTTLPPDRHYLVGLA